MWDTIVIGSGNKQNSGIHVWEIGGKHLISQNPSSFWINYREFGDSFASGIGLTIFKDTSEGMYLIKLIQEKESLESINKFLERVILDHITIDDFRVWINSLRTESYKDGVISTQTAIRNLLGLG
jgi:hypothetical protein